jgi:hypothetical protein
MPSRRFLVVVSGTKIYVAANPLRSDRRKRTKGRIATVRHLYPDFDVDGEARLTSLRTSDTVPPPTAVLATLLGTVRSSAVSTVSLSSSRKAPSNCLRFPLAEIAPAWTATASSPGWDSGIARTIRHIPSP